MRPTIALDLPAGKDTWNRTEMDISWTGGDTLSGIDHYNVSLDGSGDVNVGNATTYTLTGLDDGRHTVLVWAYDKAGNRCNSTGDLLVDTTAPEVSIIAPEEGITVGCAAIMINWTGSDDGTGISHYDVRADNGSWHNYHQSVQAFVTVDDGLEPVSGIHTVYLRAFDGAGNVAETTFEFYMDVTDPEIVDYSPLGDSVPVDSDVRVTFSEPMDRNATYMHLGGDRGYEGTVEWDGNTMIFTPNGSFEPSSDVTVYLSAYDIYANGIMFQWDFTVSSYGGTAAVPTGGVSGRIVNEAGDPVEGADIIYDSEVVGQTDADGRYTVYIPVGDHTLTVSTDGETQTIDVSVSEGETNDIGESTILPAPDTGGSNILPYVMIIIVIAAILGSLLFLRRKGGAGKPSRVDETEMSEPAESMGSE